MLVKLTPGNSVAGVVGTLTRYVTVVDKTVREAFIETLVDGNVKTKKKS